MKQIYNPYLPLYEHVPDGEPHVFDGRVYIYGSHDKENGEAFCMLDYVTYSALVDDLTNWRYEGIIYSAKQDPNYENHPYMYAPDVVKGNDGRYYLYYSLAGGTKTKSWASWIMSVAVCDTPCGKFEFLGNVRYKDGTIVKDFLMFDPGVFNDNGRIFMYYGFNSFGNELPLEEQGPFHDKTMEEILANPYVSAYVELEDDMITVKHKPRQLLPSNTKGTSFEGHTFFEASSMRKFGDTYYFMYSPRECNHEICYATSKYPDKDFVFGGTLISNGDIELNGRLPKDRLARTGNNHGSLEYINGEYYIFYHRQTHKNDFSRQACAEKIKMEKDGSFKQVEITTSGLNNGPLKAQGTYPAVICCNLTNGNMPHDDCYDIYPHITNKGEDRYIAEIEQNTLIGYKYFDFQSVQKIGIEYRSGYKAPNGKLAIILSENGEKIAQIDLKPQDNWTKAEATVQIPNGTYPLYFVYEGEGAIEMKEVYFK